MAMESSDPMEKDNVWIPMTPAKPIPARSMLQSVDTIGGRCNTEAAVNGKVLDVELKCNDNLNDAFTCIGSSCASGTSEMAWTYESNGVLDEHETTSGLAGKDPNFNVSDPATVQHDTSYVHEETVKKAPSECEGKNGYGVRNSQVGVDSVPSPSEMKNSRKRHNNGIDLNKKPSQRRRMKKHRPKILDDGKPKKVPKAQTPRTSTPKPVTPNLVQEKRKYSRKNNFTPSTRSTRGSTREVLKDVVQDDQVASNGSQIAVKSCRCSLDFQLVDQDSHHVPKSCEQPPSFNFGLREFDCFSKIVTSKRNTRRKSRFEKKNLKASKDLLGDDISIAKNQERAEKREIVYWYQRRKKSISSAAHCIPLVKKECSADETCFGLTNKTECLHNSLQVYKRTFRENQCQQNSRKSGPIFPRMFKKQRALRKKATTFGNFWYIKASEDVKGHVKRAHGRLKQTARKRVNNRVNKSKFNNNAVVESGYHMDKRLLHAISPMKEQTFSAITDLESFMCVLSLSPIARLKKKRSKGLTRRRENMMELSIPKAMPQEGNFHQIIKCLPLQEVPILEIDSFTSQHWDALQEGNTVNTLKWPPLQEVAVFESQSSLPQDQDVSNTQEDFNNLYVREMMKYLIMKMENLDINGQCKELVVRDLNVNGALVKTDPPKKRKVIPKVNLDEETMRVWKLLMENDGSETVEETDKDKEEWWERQRQVFRGRVDSFIAKMHDIQGNRRFSPWKGSVVDSVVGVYLTQNVSDHLSSSAFMSLAARFPVKSRSKEVDDHGEVASSQESVGSNTKVDGGFSNNNETEQDMSNSSAHTSDETPTTKSNQEAVSDAFPVQDEHSVNGNSNTFREILDIEEANYLRKFCSCGNDKSPSDESRVDGDLSARKGKSEEQCSGFCDLPSSQESHNTMPDLNMGLCGPSGVFGNTETENESTESQFIVQQKASSEEEPRNADPVCSLQTEVSIEESLDAENNHHDMKEKTSNSETTTIKKKSKIEEKRETKIDWEELRKTYCKSGGKETNDNYMDAVDWEAVRRATVEEIAETIVERGMNNVLAARIKEFLERMVKDHGSIDLEWLRDVPPDKAKEFLLSIQGIGLKSVECVRLLTLHHLAFPVDTNVGRVATRLGWVPLQPLPEGLEIHLLNSYPMVDNVQKYLFPRLCTIDQRTLYELHYQLITFGKVFCTKRNPNCHACPMRAECRHYASAFASQRLALPGSKKKSTVTSIVSATNEQNHSMLGTSLRFSVLEIDDSGSSYHAQDCVPIIEIPPSPEPEVIDTSPIRDIEDFFCEPDEEIPTIRLNTEEFAENLKNVIDTKNLPPEVDMSKAIVALAAEAASIRVPRMKFVAKLRTVHLVYELPDSHPLLVKFDKREPDDPCPYLLAIWLSEDEACTSFNINTEEMVKATILIPCRTANRGKFPLNGTYFQVNEVFADDETSQNPMDVPRDWLWNLRKRCLDCGTSTTSIFKALPTEDIQRCFWAGFMCVRGFNRETRQPRPLHRRFHVSTTAVAAEKVRRQKSREEIGLINERKKLSS